MQSLEGMLCQCRSDVKCAAQQQCCTRCCHFSTSGARPCESMSCRQADTAARMQLLMFAGRGGIRGGFGDQERALQHGQHAEQPRSQPQQRQQPGQPCSQRRQPLRAVRAAAGAQYPGPLLHRRAPLEDPHCHGVAALRVGHPCSSGCSSMPPDCSHEGVRPPSLGLNVY